MQSAIDNIKATYDLETCKEISEHGCQSGVCTQHIYYGDTIKFFETYEEEITNHLESCLGMEALTEFFHSSNASLDVYKNTCTWAFIEMVAMQVVDDAEEQELIDDKTIEEYVMFGGNPPRSLTESRYAHI